MGYNIQDFNFFAPETRAWFASALGTPTAVQTEAWPAIAADRHTLVSAPTGTGKTLSAFLVYIDRLVTQSRAGTLPDELQVIYISPLKSLASDIRENLRKPLNGIYSKLHELHPEDDTPPFSLSVAIRTGDTPQSERRKMAKKPPHILITTPESLYLLLTSKSGQNVLRTARAIIIDELHALIGTKRGAHMMLSLARLDTLCERPLVRIGLSATIQPLERAAAYLSPDEVVIAAPKMAKRAEIQVVTPMTSAEAAVHGTIWQDLASAVYDRCMVPGVRSVLAFTGGRQFAEKLAHYVNQIAGEGFAHAHHGSVSKDRRMETEKALREGEIRLLCATSSMELGIDVGEVDEVLQIGCPHSIASALQRLGRAGHSPGRVSIMRMYPRTNYESLFCGLTTKAVRMAAIEEAKPPRLCLDILAQHLVSMAGEGYTVDEALAIFPRAYPFRDITRKDVTDCLEMLAGDYEHDRDIPVRPRLLYDRVNERVDGDSYSRLLAISAGGTIPDRGLFAVVTENNVKLGELDEEYVFEQRVGHRFVLGAFAWRMVSIQKDRVVVAPTNREGADPPWFHNDPIGRPLQTGRLFGALFRELNEAAPMDGLLSALMDYGMDEVTAGDAADLLARQINVAGTLADDRTILVEHFSDDAGENLTMIHSIFGQSVNAPLALFFQHEAERVTGAGLSIFNDDNGILFVPNSGQAIPHGFLQTLNTDDARPVLEALLPSTALFSMTFRYNAAHALMMGVRKAGRVPLWVQRMRSAEMLASLIEHREHPLVRETTRECLEEYWDIAGMEEVLHGIASGQIQVREIYTEKPSPMSLQIRRQAEADLLYQYYPVSARVVKNAQDAVDMAHLIEPAPELLRPYERTRLPEDEAHLHSLLMMEGDVTAGEVDVPGAWFATLARQGRAKYVEPGLWIAAENEAEYTSALQTNDTEAQKRLARRLLRYRGAQTAESLAERYFLSMDAAEAILTALCDEKAAIAANGAFYHAELYDRARRDTIYARRKEQTTLPAERYAALLAFRLRIPAPPAEQLAAAVRSLTGKALIPSQLEEILLPARVQGYRPAMLDTLLAQGEVVWRLVPDDDGHVRLTFAPYAQLDWDAEPAAPPDDMEGQVVFDALVKRGASFSQGLYSLLPNARPADVLLTLAAKGFVRADSFAPVRQWIDREKLAKSPVKAQARIRAANMSAGRWELCRPLLPPDWDALLDDAFDKTVILCRETAKECGLPWASALERLGIWEMTGKARRGYFVEGMSGAQFIREAEFAGTTLALSHPRDEVVWLSAVDTLQPWGKTLPHMDGRAFSCLAGTAVALFAGRVVCVLEKQGASLRVFEAAHLAEALAAFTREYAQRRLFAWVKRITLKSPPPEAIPALEAAGFERAMDTYTVRQGYI